LKARKLKVQNIIEIIDKRLSNEQYRAKESITTKAEELPKLPKIKIPTFFGDSKEWDLFNELFMELIYTRKDLTTALKFN